MKELNEALGMFMLNHFEDEGAEHILTCNCPACILWRKVSAMGEKRGCVACPGVRDQVVLTPLVIVERLRRLWPEGIAYDAASAPGTHTRKGVWIDSVVNADAFSRTRGLLDPWPHRTYCNPPYGTSLFDPENQMEDYLRELAIRAVVKEENDRRKKEGIKTKATPKFPEGLPIPKAGLAHWLLHQLEQSEGESVMLVPNRTHRDWFRAWRHEINGLFELNPLQFLGYPSAYPAPLVLGYRGDDTERFWWAF